MPLTALLRSLIDTCVLGIWFLKYAKDEEVADSVAHLSMPEMVKSRFLAEDRMLSYLSMLRVRVTSCGSSLSPESRDGIAIGCYSRP